jgi:two-component system LytT family response regulator
MCGATVKELPLEPFENPDFGQVSMEIEPAGLRKPILVSRALAHQPPPRIAIKVKGRILFIRPADVIAIEAQGNYVALRCGSSTHLLRESISAVAEKLESNGFIRIHRSVLVNISFVEEIRPHTTGEYILQLKGGKKYTVTRIYKKNLKSLAESWIGTGVFFPD